MSAHGVGTFIAAQVLADIKWTPVGLKAADWYTFAASGPGSRRGLRRLLGLPVYAGKSVFGASEEEWNATLLRLRKAVLPKLPKELRKLDAQNLQSTLCEYDKYSRVDEGRRPKQYFKESEIAY